MKRLIANLKAKWQDYIGFQRFQVEYRKRRAEFYQKCREGK